MVDHASLSDDPTVITGSHNWSSSAENVNDENTVIVHDARVANLYHQEFQAILIALGAISSVGESGEGTQCLVYPNPARGMLNVEWLEGKPDGPLVLRDLSGRIVLTAPLHPGTSRISTTGLASGVYMATFGSASGATRIAIQ
jgi:phosphatidylserine/phosphatidylglycerophosphate/cardiolipin synthase-like enzyme